MRIIHTSDWHFGKRLLDYDMLSLQQEFCDWFVDLVKQESIDAVLIAGDVYDRANPKDDAIELLDDVLHRISSHGASIVVISGNHDSAERLHFGTRFMKSGGLHVRTERKSISDIGSPLTLTGRDGTELEVLPLPYLDPERVALAEGTARSHETVLKAVIDFQKSRLRNPAQTIAMSHAFVTGGQQSESERNLTVGGTGSVSLNLFDDFGYVALGHLHRPQEMGDGRVVYSGTPMPYSFSEEHEKYVQVISIEDSRISSSKIKSSQCRPVVTLEGSLEELTSSSKFENSRNSFVRARITNSNFQVGAMEKLRSRFPYALELEQTALSAQGHIGAARLKDLTRKNKADVVHEYVKETWPEGLTEFEESFINESLKVTLTGDHK